MKIDIVKIETLKTNKDNPRIIKDDKYKKLVKSIKEFPKMLEIRPIVVDENMVVLGGNMRLKACVEAGLKEVPIIKADELTEEQKKEFIIKDNVGYGEWDWDVLANEWDAELLDEWGLDVPYLTSFEDAEIEEVDMDALSFSFNVKCENIEELNTLKSRFGVEKNSVKYLEIESRL